MKKKEKRRKEKKMKRKEVILQREILENREERKRKVNIFTCLIMSFEGDLTVPPTVVAELLVIVKTDLSLPATVLVTMVTIDEAAEDDGDLAMETGIIVILVGVFAGDRGTLLICSAVDFVGVPAPVGVIAVTTVCVGPPVVSDGMIVCCGVMVIVLGVDGACEEPCSWPATAVSPGTRDVRVIIWPCTCNGIACC